MPWRRIHLEASQAGITTKGNAMTPSRPSPRPWTYDMRSPCGTIFDADWNHIATCWSTSSDHTSLRSIDPKANAALIIEAVNGHGVVSEDMVEAACQAYRLAEIIDNPDAHDGFSWPNINASAAANATYRARVRGCMRAALTAALAARGGGGDV